MLVEVLSALARYSRACDQIEIFYCPAKFSEPDWQFPQIERIGPVTPTFSLADNDPAKPLCVVLGIGLETGLSMGIISHLEPRLSYCFWGTGVDGRFDAAVKRANFDFEFMGFNTKTLRYHIPDPVGAYSILESVVYGLLRDYRVIVVPMGPKIFTFLSVLVGMTYLGDVSIWRAKHSRVEPHDALPGEAVIRSVLDPDALSIFSSREANLIDEVV